MITPTELAPVINPIVEKETSRVFNHNDINGMYPPNAIPKPKVERNIGDRVINSAYFKFVLFCCGKMSYSIFVNLLK